MQEAVLSVVNETEVFTFTEAGQIVAADTEIVSGCAVKAPSFI